MLQVSISYTSKHAPQLLNKLGLESLIFGGRGLPQKHIFVNPNVCYQPEYHVLDTSS